MKSHLCTVLGHGAKLEEFGQVVEHAEYHDGNHENPRIKPHNLWNCLRLLIILRKKSISPKRVKTALGNTIRTLVSRSVLLCRKGGRRISNAPQWWPWWSKCFLLLEIEHTHNTLKASWGNNPFLDKIPLRRNFHDCVCRNLFYNQRLTL